jgi:starch synthase
VPTVARKPLRIFLIAAEAVPFVKVGGLADVAGALPQALLKLPEKLIHHYKLDVRLCIPYYPQIKSIRTRFVTELYVQSTSRQVKLTCFETQVGGLTTYLLKSPVISRERTIYSSDVRQDGSKFILFSLATLELLKRIDWKVDILHANDWHTAVALHQLVQLRRRDPFFSRTHSLITLHNLPYMGAGIDPILDNYGISPSQDPHLPTWARTVPLPMGLAAAEKIVAVSKKYASEIKTRQFGCGLEDFFRSSKKRLCGIKNGIDTSTWDPANDPFLHHNYQIISLTEKVRNKTFILNALGITADPVTPLLIFIGRMDQQKGVDMIPDVLTALSGEKWNALILGSGAPALEVACKQLEVLFPTRVRVFTRFDTELSHQLYAAGDILLMPSRYEPCGLSQMIAMRYGCIPVAANTGGLHDTIQPLAKDPRGTGFLFQPSSRKAFLKGITCALVMYKDAKKWRRLQARAMAADNRWQRSAETYLAVYQELIRKDAG